ncbi:MAG TPA: hypothetical protein VMI72_17030 [Roseiarcus sp.]|nr:hypothetical protein [Roseiarcus sp.]
MSSPPLRSVSPATLWRRKRRPASPMGDAPVTQEPLGPGAGMAATTRHHVDHHHHVYHNHMVYNHHHKGSMTGGGTGGGESASPSNTQP